LVREDALQIVRLRQTFHWRANQNNERQLAALGASLAMAGIEPDEGVPLIAPLLELPLGDKYPSVPMAPDQQRGRLLSTLVRWTIGFAKAQPLVFVIEDLHWADPSTLELIQLLAEQSATAPLLLLYTTRPEFRVSWPFRAHHIYLTLSRLRQSARWQRQLSRAASAVAPLEAGWAVVDQIQSLRTTRILQIHSQTKKTARLRQVLPGALAWTVTSISEHRRDQCANSRANRYIASDGSKSFSETGVFGIFPFER
jgi:hypothetical protein